MHNSSPRKFSSNVVRLGITAALAVGTLGSLPAPAEAAVPTGLLAAGVAGQGFGSIKGRLVWAGDKAPEREVLKQVGKADRNPEVCAAKEPILDNELIVDPSTKGVRFAFVYVTAPKGDNPDARKALLQKAPTVEIDQKNCQFVPPVVALMEDQKVVFKSSDPVGHNVNYASFTAAFNTMLAPQGQMEKKLASERRPVPLKCDIHPWMKAYMLVLGHPFFTVTGEDGSFEIKGVPAGVQKVVIWQGSVGYVNKERALGFPVTVPAGGAVDLGEIRFEPSRVKKVAG
jgi:hypothetical protein